MPRRRTGSKRSSLEQQIAVDKEHPLCVYIPCGVGGAPGGICFGLKQEFGDQVHVFFVEPTEAPCMLLGLSSGVGSGICVQDIGLTGRTAADGLTISRCSGLAGQMVKDLVEGGFTVADERLVPYMRALHESEGIFCGAFGLRGFRRPRAFP